ncbi:MAG: hypothetical protein K8U57_40480 [Planctomycetes bacterium]|nr:hypothetical protein [Planctomycetota bacterium]
MPVKLSCPWRSVWLPRIITAVVLFAGLPIYLRMPLWCDLSLYDLAARNILTGGVHYRDVFDTNLPGFVWVLAGIRAVLGYGAFSLRCVDLAIVTGIVLLIDHLAKRGGASLVARWWAIVGVSLLYPFAVEMAHCQRDTWMALPILLAVVLRLRRLEKPSTQPFLMAVLEGLLWASAVWIKPHVVLMAAGVWLITARRLAAVSPSPWRAFAADLFGNLLGGLALGAAGVYHLVESGTWDPHFRLILEKWAPEYAALGRRELDDRVDLELHWFPPWSLWLTLTLPLALLSILDAVPWRGSSAATGPEPGQVGRRLPAWLWDREAGPNARFVRGTMATLWLVWAFQAFYIQRGFMYVHMAETLIMFGLWAAHRWAMPFIVVVWLTVCGVAWVIADSSPTLHATLMRVAAHDGHSTGEDPDKEHYLVRHPLADPVRMGYWWDCWEINKSDHDRYVLWDHIKRYQDHEASPGWVELEEVADELRKRGVGDRELIAWHDSPHVLYLTMNLQPGLRYMHTNTAMGISPEAYMRVLGDLFPCAGKAKYAVSDLGWAGLGQDDPNVKAAMLGPPVSKDDLLPAGLSLDHKQLFPFNKPAVFRSTDRNGNPKCGRYIIHELSGPLGDLPPLPRGKG